MSLSDKGDDRVVDERTESNDLACKSDEDDDVVFVPLVKYSKELRC